MSARADSLTAIATVAAALGELAEQVVFVGGTVVALYPLEGGAHVRPTIDVDCVVNVATTGEYYAFVEALRARGFKECTDDAGRHRRHTRTLSGPRCHCGVGGRAAASRDRRRPGPSPPCTRTLSGPRRSATKPTELAASTPGFVALRLSTSWPARDTERQGASRRLQSIENRVAACALRAGERVRSRRN